MNNMAVLIEHPQLLYGMKTVATFRRYWSTVLIFVVLFSVIYYFFVYAPSHVITPHEIFCDDEPMTFVSYDRRYPSKIGKRFSCQLVPLLRKFGLDDRSKYERKPFKKDDVVFVTYSSSNHFSEARASLTALRNQSDNKIIFYDLGLSKTDIQELGNVCNLEIRNFDFENYPAFVRQLYGYHFKPILMAEVFASLEAFWIMDTSVRFSAGMDAFLANVNSGAIEPLALRHTSSHSIYAATHKDMYSYLPIEPILSKEQMLDANTIFIQKSNFAKDALKWNLLCALTEGCMSPAGARLRCWFGDDRDNIYANCHRFDQSAINIIATSLLERDGWPRRDRPNGDDMGLFTSVERGQYLAGPLSIPCSGNR